VLTVLSLARAAILIMMTSFTRIIIVLSLLRRRWGTQQLPPNQVLIGLAMFMTFLIMGPDVGARERRGAAAVPRRAIDQPTRSTGAGPVRDFMIAQIRGGERRGRRPVHRASRASRAEQWGDVGTMTLVPAFMLSELKTAFLLGFKVYLPFLIIDIVISHDPDQHGHDDAAAVMISLRLNCCCSF
jgi:flagellar biosynthetic protein FliP